MDCGCNVVNRLVQLLNEEERDIVYIENDMIEAVMESYEGEFEIDTVITAMESDKSSILALRGSELR